MCITASSVSFIGSRENSRAAERLVRLQVGWENGWGGQSRRSSPGPSASEQTRQSGGATVGPTGARSNPNASVGQHLESSHTGIWQERWCAGRLEGDRNSFCLPLSVKVSNG